MKNIFIIIVASLFVFSCEQKDCCDLPPSNPVIKLSKEEVNFSASANTETITVEISDTWVVSSIHIDDVLQDFDNGDEGLNNISKPFKFDFFQIEKQDKSIVISVDKNITNAKRIVIIIIEANGWSSNGITITQAVATGE